jgi:uncharacterized protein
VTFEFSEILDLVFTHENFLVLLIVFAGGIIRGYTGFGSGLVMVPLFSLMWSPVDAVATTCGLGLFAAAQLALSNAKITKWREVSPMIVALVCVTPIGTYMLVSLDPDIVKKVIAGLVLFVTAISLKGWQYHGPRGVIPSFIAGSIGAFINGLAAVGGPAVVLYFISLPDEVKVQRSNIATIASLMGVAVFSFTFLSGHVGPDVWWHILLFAVPYMLSTYAGMYLFRRLPGAAFRLIVLWILVAISIAILLA